MKKQKPKKFRRTQTMKTHPIPTRKIHSVKKQYKRSAMKAELQQEIEELKE
jgi:hypothetical protein